MSPAGPLGHPRLHLAHTTSTNDRARALAAAGAPHGTLVTAAEQTAGRGRQGRTWTAPPGRSLLCSIVVRDPPRLLPLAAGAAVAGAVDAFLEAAGPADGGGTAAPAAPRRPRVAIKWPNDVLLDGGKVAGILVEGRLQERWAVVGIGLNVAVAEADFPPELQGRAATLGLEPGEIEPTLRELLARLERWLAADTETLLAEVRARDALLGQPVRWAGGEGRGDGIDGDGRLVVVAADGGRVALDAGEVHLGGT
jgi:BirA family transcriptional regulator, biotin operon repressor / biotin---[acetyl-CoA-carboxylase] ligase